MLRDLTMFRYKVRQKMLGSTVSPKYSVYVVCDWQVK